MRVCRGIRRPVPIGYASKPEHFQQVCVSRQSVPGMYVSMGKAYNMVTVSFPLTVLTLSALDLCTLPLIFIVQVPGL